MNIRQLTKTIFFSLIALTIFTGVDCKGEPVQSRPASADTTSHNFTVLRVDTLGSIFSFANGVDIVNENNIWVAGIFTEKDTDGTILYNKNLAHWDGITWTLMSIPMYGYNNTGPSPEELGGVKVFSDSNIFVVTKHDNSVAWWNGKTWTSNYVNDATVSPIFWARSPDDIYFVAREGRATHYNGQTFTKITTGLTNPPLTDVWGDEGAVYAVGTGESTENTDAVFLTGNKTNWTIANKYDVKNTSVLPPYQYVGGMYSGFRANRSSTLWLIGSRNVLRALYAVETIAPFRAKIIFDFTSDNHAYSVRGTADNDIYIANQKNAVFYHFNGKTMCKYEPTVNNFLMTYSTGGFCVNGNTWAFVGFPTGGGIGRAIVITGKHE